MKKITLSLSLIFVFVAYTIFQRANSVDQFSSTPLAVADKKSIVTSPLPASNTPTVPPVVKKVPPPVSTPPAPIKGNKVFNDGTYAGSIADAYYGNVQVQIITKSDRIVDIQFLDHPQDRGTSVRINNYAMPILKTEAIQAQSANVNTVSGATETSRAFRESLGSAISQAKSNL